MLRSAFGFDLDQTLLKCATGDVAIAEQRWSPRFVFAVHEFAGGPKPKGRDVGGLAAIGWNADIPPRR